MLNALYSEKQSLLHRLNPLTKLIATFPLVAFLTVTTNIWTPLTFCLFIACLTIILGKVSIKHYVKVLLPLLVFTGGFVISYPFMVSGHMNMTSQVLVEFGPIQVKEAGVLFGLSSGLRLLSIFLVTLLFTLTTDSADFIRALIQQWRLNYRFGYGTLAVLRFIPILNKQFQLVRMAHHVRGYSGKGVSRRIIDRTQKYVVPLLASSIRHAERTAYSMDARGFGAYCTRTYYRKLSFQKKDWLFIIVFWLCTILLVFVLYRFQLLGSLSFLKMFL